MCRFHITQINCEEYYNCITTVERLSTTHLPATWEDAKACSNLHNRKNMLNKHAHVCCIAAKNIPFSPKLYVQIFEKKKNREMFCLSMLNGKKRNFL